MSYEDIERKYFATLTDDEMQVLRKGAAIHHADLLKDMRESRRRRAAINDEIARRMSAGTWGEHDAT